MTTVEAQEVSNVRDVTPLALRQEWAAVGHYPGRDLYGFFADQARNRLDQAAVIDDAGPVSYGELLGAAERVAEVLSRHGIRSGDLVGVQLPNGWQACALDLAVAAVGAVCLPYPVHFREQETRMLLGRSKATAAVVCKTFGGHDHQGMVEGLRADLPDLRTILTVGGDGVPSLDDALRGGPSTWTASAISPDAPVRVIATSGTEAAPKMLLYSHNAIAGPLSVVAGRLRPRPGWRLLLLVPLPSALGALGIYGVMAGHGGTLVVTSSFSAERALAMIAEHRVTHIVGVPTVFQIMLAHPDFKDCDVSSVEVVVTGGAAAAPATIADIQDGFGCDYATFYGSSDGSFCSTRFDDPPDRITGTVGRDDPAVSTLRVVDDHGRDLPPGEQGEVWALGPFSPLCYLGDPELDLRYRSEDGWVRTGDLGVMDTEGYLRIVGRLKDVIIRGGYNVSPGEVEKHVVAHPGIALAACVGAPDERLGERIVVFLVLRPESQAPTIESLGQFLLGRGLAKNKLPERIVVVEELPVNPAGKVLKRVLRSRLAAEVEPDVAGAASTAP
jgi:non-ribosomal peptide synthetase component E (peptide arylation enzyme)